MLSFRVLYILDDNYIVSARCGVRESSSLEYISASVNLSSFLFTVTFASSTGLGHRVARLRQLTSNHSDMLWCQRAFRLRSSLRLPCLCLTSTRDTAFSLITATFWRSRFVSVNGFSSAIGPWEPSPHSVV